MEHVGRYTIVARAVNAVLSYVAWREVAVSFHTAWLLLGREKSVARG